MKSGTSDSSSVCRRNNISKRLTLCLPTLLNSTSESEKEKARKMYYSAFLNKLKSSSERITEIPRKSENKRQSISKKNILENCVKRLKQKHSRKQFSLHRDNAITKETARKEYLKQSEKLQHVMFPIKLNSPRRVFSLRNSTINSRNTSFTKLNIDINNNTVKSGDDSPNLRIDDSIQLLLKADSNEEKQKDLPKDYYHSNYIKNQNILSQHIERRVISGCGSPITKVRFSDNDQFEVLSNDNVRDVRRRTCESGILRNQLKSRDSNNKLKSCLRNNTSCEICRKMNKKSLQNINSISKLKQEKCLICKKMFTNQNKLCENRLRKGRGRLRKCKFNEWTFRVSSNN